MPEGLTYPEVLEITGYLRGSDWDTTFPIAVGQAKPSPAVVPVIGAEDDNATPLPQNLKLDTLERDLLNKAMAQAKNNKSQAAKLLGVPRGQFYSLLKRHGLTDAKR